MKTTRSKNTDLNQIITNHISKFCNQYNDYQRRVIAEIDYAEIDFDFAFGVNEKVQHTENKKIKGKVTGQRINELGVKSYYVKTDDEEWIIVEDCLKKIE